MAGNMSRNKGQRGEREVIQLLQPIVDKLYLEAHMDGPKLRRNLMQSQDGGFDVAGLEWLALEVKFQEIENTTGWWKQTCKQAGTDLLGNSLVPIDTESWSMKSITRSGRIESVLGQWGSDHIKIPVLIFRSNNKQWKILMVGRLFHGKFSVRTLVRVDLQAFLAWFEMTLRLRLQRIEEFRTLKWKNINEQRS